jgi:hypothetical protein
MHEWVSDYQIMNIVMALDRCVLWKEWWTHCHEFILNFAHIPTLTHQLPIPM